VTNIIHDLPEWNTPSHNLAKQNAYEEISKAWAIVIKEASKRGGGIQLQYSGWEEKLRDHNEKSGGRVGGAYDEMMAALGWLRQSQSSMYGGQQSVRQQLFSGSYGVEQSTMRTGNWWRYWWGQLIGFEGVILPNHEFPLFRIEQVWLGTDMVDWDCIAFCIAYCIYDTIDDRKWLFNTDTPGQWGSGTGRFESKPRFHADSRSPGLNFWHFFSVHIMHLNHGHLNNQPPTTNFDDASTAMSTQGQDFYARNTGSWYVALLERIAWTLIGAIVPGSRPGLW
jgi:hypothetical protein